MTSPADCVKTKMQVMPESNPTIRAAMKAIYEVGIQGLPYAVLFRSLD